MAAQDETVTLNTKSTPAPKALKLILDFEGLNQPGKWPGGNSSITLGYYGYDLGHVTASKFAEDWAGCFTPAEMSRLKGAIGRTGPAAQALAPSLANIKCRAADARRVLLGVSIPVYVERTRKALPGFDLLPLDVQGALVSLVYNRGSGMKDSPGTDNRKEMRAIREFVARGMISGIAEQLRAMKRLWQGKGLDGLMRRRDAEAALIESSMAALLRALRGVPRGLSRRLQAVRPKRKTRSAIKAKARSLSVKTHSTGPGARGKSPNDCTQTPCATLAIAEETAGKEGRASPLMTRRRSSSLYTSVLPSTAPHCNTAPLGQSQHVGRLSWISAAGDEEAARRVLLQK